NPMEWRKFSLPSCGSDSNWHTSNIGFDAVNSEKDVSARIRKRAKRAILASHRTRPFGALRLLRAGSHGAKSCLFGMTSKGHGYFVPRTQLSRSPVARRSAT